MDTALKAMTIWPAWQHFEEETKGSIEVGKLADFVVLSENPLEVPPEQLAQIKILETIKEGQYVYRRDDIGTYCQHCQRLNQHSQVTYANREYGISGAGLYQLSPDLIFCITEHNGSRPLLSAI